MNKGISWWLLILAALFSVALVVSNLIAGKLWAAPFGIVLPAAVWLFPIVYLIGDVVPEVYGLSVARRVIWLGFGLNAFAILFFFICLRLPSAGFWTGQSSFEFVLGFAPRLLIASFVGYLVGTNVNAWVLVTVKRLTKSRWLWTRTISSTICGEAVDSALFISIAFVGVVPSDQLRSMIFWQATFKIVYEILATPLTYWVVAQLKKKEGLVDTREGLTVPRESLDQTPALAIAEQSRA